MAFAGLTIGVSHAQAVVPRISTLAARILRGYEPTLEEVRSLAASILSQDEAKGQGSQNTALPSSLIGDAGGQGR
jgi:hypothetical protein